MRFWLFQLFHLFTNLLLPFNKSKMLFLASNWGLDKQKKMCCTNYVIQKMKRIYQKGFTLVELLVVIAVLGVLAAGVLTAINPAKRIRQANDANLKSSEGQIVNALQAYFTANQVYPTGLGDLVTSNDLKSVPTQPGGDAFGYAVTASCTESSCEAAVWGSLADVPAGTTEFYCWDSTNNAFKNSATVPTAAAPTICP